ncbi:multiple epidermal growth factor-like domains protein 11 isoform X2 [Biomphalaria glabrata]|uniref:Multiple epidermal growth factor-like domains protein 11 isoform X2 n=1 Tax=Biomphalaria glabrata TaxID=6526 RepID=A0A9W3AAQ6_BIOGL|nr:multiple epidermal growth factor-like domains protein 11 isoform X2 [Biomphalaria glabrata]
MNVLFKCFILSIVCYVYTACPLNYFGPSCRYKCNCLKGCDKFGACLNNSDCIPGWFGYLCQLHERSDTMGGSVNVSNDNFQTSLCINGSRSVEVDNGTIDVYCTSSAPVKQLRVRTFGVTGECHISISKDCIISLSRLPCDADYCKRCFNFKCDRSTGQCYVACLGYSNFPYCDQPCRTGQFGLNCIFRCSQNCYGGICDPASGLCLNGCNGFSNPPMCNIPCIGSHGHNCMCDASCQVCKTGSRVCQSCLDGYVVRLNKTTECIPMPARGIALFSTSLLRKRAPLILSVLIFETLLVILIVIFVFIYHRKTRIDNHSESD